MTPFVVKKIVKEIKLSKVGNDPIRILYLIKDLLSPRLLKSAFDIDLDTAIKKREIILSLDYYG